MKIIGEGGEIAAVGFGAQHLVKKKNTDVCLKNDHEPDSGGQCF